MSIRPDYLTLDSLLQGKLFHIPDYQRAYSWETKQRQDLFNDIGKLVEDKKKPSDDKKNERHHYMATVVCLRKGQKEEIGTDEFIRYDIVDGQQRVTTLIILLKAIAKRLKVSEDEERQKEANKIDELLIKSRKQLILLQTNHDSVDIFRDYLEKGYIRDEETVDTLAGKNLIRAFKECEELVEDWDGDENKGTLLLLKIIKNRLDFIFYVIEDEGAVYTVFEVLNSRGLDVDWLDKCKSMLMGTAFEGLRVDTKEDLLVELRKHWSKMYRIIGVREISGDEILKFTATLSSTDTQSKILSPEKSVELFANSCKDKPENVVDISSRLVKVADSLKNLYKNPRLKAVTEISQARLLAVAMLLNQQLSEEERKKLLNLWEKVTFRIYGIFRKDSRTKVGEYTRLAQRIYNMQSKPDISQLEEEIAGLGSDHLIDEGIRSISGSDCYNGWEYELRYLLYRYEEYLALQAGVNVSDDVWKLIWSDTPLTTIEHIHPKAKDPHPWWHEKIKNPEKEKLIHCLGNLILLPPNINSKCGVKSFPDKKAIYNDHSIRLVREILTEDDWNEDSICQREQKLLAWMKSTWA